MIKPRYPSRLFRRARALVLVAILATTVLILLQLAPQRSSAVKGGTATPVSPSAPASVSTPPAGGNSLDASIDGVLAANSQYQVGVALLDLGSGSVQQYGVEAPFEAASTAKVLTAVAYYKMVEAGEVSLDDPMGEYPAGFQLQEMIQDSDNDSWALLADAVGHDTLRDDAAAMGVSYDPEANTLTTAGMARILADLYEGKLLNQEHTQQLLSYMQDTNDEDLIPAALPAGVSVFHKYGLLNGELHDAAILATATRSVVLVIYTKGSDLSDVPQRTDVIHQITAAVARTLT
ncbi:serine hydrolase [Arthrobacter sp. ISL-85]|uniref:serine hydrolase n=1 Tax=Arthrobacter sp. ISL-85 TaxID=2819115 RepID=UPI00288A18BF|nr:serine hydrolase [Arthrobacter sp. ISL-85]